MYNGYLDIMLLWRHETEISSKLTMRFKFYQLQERRNIARRDVLPLECDRDEVESGS